MTDALKILQDLVRAQNGSVAMIFAVAAVPITLLTGMGVDYTLAVDRQVQLNAAADAAVLAAITPAMMSQTTDVASQAATDTFNAQASAITGVTYSPSDVSVTIATSGAKRVVTLKYAARSQNVFAGVVSMDTIALSGGSQGTGGQAPNIDFYLLLDDSPSMAIAATQAGINTMLAHTTHQENGGGCAFACHETHPSSDNLGNPNGEDNFALAQSLGVTLRVDLLRQASQNLMTIAQSTEATTTANYRMAIYTFDQGFNTIAALTSDLSTAKTQAGNIQLQQVYANNWLTSSNKNNDADTNYGNAMTSINAVMPNPGSGTSMAGDKPQEVLFFVTDGVNEVVNGARLPSVMDPAQCAAIKARGIRIAVLYTEYLPLPTDSYYQGHVASFQSNIGPSLQSCASPGLYSVVQTGGDISTALANLFQYAVQSAYLSQ
jgi:Flp pilus assembly protein TadG